MISWELAGRLGIVSLCLMLGGCAGYVVRAQVQLSAEDSAPLPADRHAAYLELAANPQAYKVRATNQGQVWTVMGERSWCGFMPMLVVPIPLMLPVCAARSEYLVAGEAVLRRTDTVVRDSGYVCSPINAVVGIGGERRWCRPK